jgi:tetratricopeptide (TPR) repeat protein
MMIAVQTNNLACTYSQLKDYETARTLHKQAIAAATSVDAERWLGVFQADLGATLAALNRLDEAEPLFLSAVERSEHTGDLENLVRAQARLATLYVRTGRLDEAADLAGQAEQRARKMYYQRGIADAVASLGDVDRARNDEKAAQQHYAEALRLYTILHDPGARRVAEFVPQGA